ncbi:MarR family winged helix-turn-helix transcriptional regulator [Microbacterium sp. ASV81]|uniref:MarR family transcriptional regulator n=1 Tax=Microbacterium capsulatum TaxID=3041921 RepID=A0ABU0XBT5_9MICO|nr:MarR family transcriptional regulator [Microbacterium sp. ASV81]MDQ4212573.1 MarR family transcriptional regulator [Microbacterium sp. ASV81]
MAERAGRSRLTREQLRIWRGFIETSNELRGRLAARLQSESGLSDGDYQVLLALSEAEGRTLRSAELAALIGWERSRLSHHLGRMERRGLVARDAAEDPRGVDVRITPQGAEAFRAGSVPHFRAVRELFVDALTPDQLAQVAELTEALRRQWDGLAAE